MAGSARWAVDRAVDTVRERFGRAAVGYAPVVFREDGGVPDEFRELAEADDPDRPDLPTGPTAASRAMMRAC